MELANKYSLYTVRRRKIYKGKIAPTGTIFIEIRVEKGKKVFTMIKHFKGGMNNLEIKNMTDVMYSHLKEKYNFE